MPHRQTATYNRDRPVDNLGGFYNMNQTNGGTPAHGKNDHRFDDFMTLIGEIGKQAGQGTDAQIKGLLAVADNAYQGVLDTTANKHGQGVDDATRAAETYWKVRGNSTIFDSKKSNQRKTASYFRTAIRVGGMSSFGVGEPIGTINKLMGVYQKLRKDPVNRGKLDDAANTFMKFARKQLKSTTLLDDAELNACCFLKDPEVRTVEDEIEAIRKKAKALYDGKAKAGACNTPEIKAIITAATKMLTIIANARKGQQAPEGVVEGETA
jgi:hypothetical protein